MKKGWIWMLAGLWLFVGCGTTMEKVVDNQGPSVKLLAPNRGEVVIEGSGFTARWNISADENFNYNESYDIYYFLIPQGSTIIRSGDGTTFNADVGGYDLGGWVPVPKINEGGTYIVMPIDIPEGTYKFKIYLTKHSEYYCLDFSEVLSADESDDIFTVKIDSAVFATDSDKSINYLQASIMHGITPQNYPDLFITGVGKGIYQGSNTNLIFGQEPNIEIAKLTTDNFSTYYDHCSSSTQLNEAYVTIDGKLSAVGVQCPNGCQNGACIP